MITNPKSNPSLIKILKKYRNKNGQFLQKLTKILFGHAQIRKHYVMGHTVLGMKPGSSFEHSKNYLKN